MALYRVDPLSDSRWRRFLERQHRSTVFHTPEWLECLHRTYSYTPLVLTLTPPGQELENGVLFCRMESWLTGRRLVSLPFSDHCDLLADRPDDLPLLWREMADHPEAREVRYIELRPIDAQTITQLEHTPFQTCARFYHHQLDLLPGPKVLYSHFHKDCVQRKIRKAEREELTYREDRSSSLLMDFYRLMLRTRRRQGLLPQPFAWHKNLADHLGSSMRVHVVYHKSQPVAGIVTLVHKHRMVYKYGCSDERFNALGGMQMLFWRAIQEACASGLAEFDLGRTDRGNIGLKVFKDRWGAKSIDLGYWRNPPACTPVENRDYLRILGKAVAFAPLRMLQAVGTLLYRHVG